MRKVIDINRGGAEDGYIARGLGHDGYGTHELYVKLLDLFANHVTPQGVDIHSIQINGPGGFTYYPVYAGPSDAEKAVAKGAKFLDTLFQSRDWRDTIVERQDDLDLSNGSHCILGLTATLAHVNEGFWGFSSYLKAIGVTTPETSDQWMVERGFERDPDDHHGFGRFTYAELQGAWERELLIG